MKRLLLILFFALGATVVQAQVRFEVASTDEVRNMAIKAKKLVFIELYTTWCPSCQTMDKEVFTRRDVTDFMSKYFVATQYNINLTETGAALMDRYGYGQIPFYMVFTTDGVMIGSIQGACKADEFLGYLQKIIDSQSGQK